MESLMTIVGVILIPLIAALLAGGFIVARLNRKEGEQTSH